MKRLTLVLLFCSLIATAAPAAELALYDSQSSWGARFANVLHEFREHRISHPSDGKILYAREEYSFAGTAEDANKFLQSLQPLAQQRAIVVTLTGPNGLGLFEPLTVAAAQSGPAYDWHVQKIQGKVNVIVPLGARIPFANLVIPSAFRVESHPGAPKAASTFARLHNEER